MRKFQDKFEKRGGRVKAAVLNERGDFYISDAVKVIIAVVLGSLLLVAMTALFNDTVLPRITAEIEGLLDSDMKNTGKLEDSLRLRVAISRERGGKTEPDGTSRRICSREEGNFPLPFRKEYAASGGGMRGNNG